MEQELTTAVEAIKTAILHFQYKVVKKISLLLTDLEIEIHWNTLVFGEKVYNPGFNYGEFAIIKTGILENVEDEKLLR